MENYKNIKGKSLIGKNNMLFLINDTNDELMIHYDSSYKTNFNKTIFFNQCEQKINISEKYGAKYIFFISPDKSVVCGKNLPFETNICNRIDIDFIKTIKCCYDLYENSNLTIDDYFNSDSHVNFNGAKKIVSNLLKIVFPSIIINFDIIEETFVIYNRLGDLADPINYKYEEPQPNIFIDNVKQILLGAHIQDKSSSLPFKFKFIYSRQSVYHINNQPMIDKKILYFCDSTTFSFLSVYLSSIFKESLYYWDHWFFNEEIIDYFKPDYIFEIRTERLLNTVEYFHGNVKHIFYDKMCNIFEDNNNTEKINEIIDKMKKHKQIISDDEIKINCNKCEFISKF